MIFSALYIIAVSVLCILTTRFAPVPSFDRFDSISRNFFLACLGFAAFAGWILPHEIQESIGWDFGSNWLSRVAQIFGAIGAVYVAARGLVIWGSIIVLGLLIIAVGKVGAFIFG
jgi:multisubunit Na+/H+ antiporter MnhB subunit